jgi:hypothetical protein
MSVLQIEVDAGGGWQLVQPYGQKGALHCSMMQFADNKDGLTKAAWFVANDEAPRAGRKWRVIRAFFDGRREPVADADLAKARGHD